MAQWRRMGSIIRMDGIMADVENWFFYDDLLSNKIDSFVLAIWDHFVPDDSYGFEANKEGVKGNYIFSRDDPDEEKENSRRRALMRKEFHNSFQRLFETELEGYLTSKKISFNQFEQVFQISQDEEIREGQHFYRWDEAAEYIPFLTMVQHTFMERMDPTTKQNRPSYHLKEYIIKKMEEARLELRRRKAILPLFDKWDINDINELLRVIALKDCPLRKDESKKDEKKFMTRWRVKLVQKQRESLEKTTDRATLADYFGRACEDLEEAEFDNVLTWMHLHVDSLQLNEQQRRKRKAWELFLVMDVMFTGTVSYDRLLKFLQRHEDERFRNKDWKKITTKYSHLLKHGKRELDQDGKLVERLGIDLATFQAFIVELLHDLPLEQYNELIGWFVKLKKDIEGS